MSMKRIFALFCCVLCMAWAVALAHSGRTDSNGGHWDRSEGTYHYHHGFPAHQHTNGKCPYDFVDKTGQNSGSSGSSSKTIKTYATPKPTLKPTAKPIANNTHQYDVDIPYQLWPYIIGSVILFAIFLRKRYKKRAEEQFAKEVKQHQEEEAIQRKIMNEKRQAAEKRLREELKKKEEEEKEKRDRAIAELLSRGRTLREISGMPNDTIIGEDGLPKTKDAIEYWGDKYTGFLARTSDIVHKAGCRYRTETSRPVNIAEMYHKKRFMLRLLEYEGEIKFCSLCCKNEVQDHFKWYTVYLEAKKQFEKLGVEPDHDE
jgi:hypothetical protein